MPSVAPWFVTAILLACSAAYAADPPPLARARMLYNALDYDGAIAAAAIARMQPTTADAAALVEARARLERSHHRCITCPDAAELDAARQALNAINAAALSPRDQVDFLVGLAQFFYLTDLFGSAAEMFETALDRGASLPTRDRTMLLAWWAQALEREAQSATPARRIFLGAEMAARMKEELRRDPGNAAANYWLVVGERGTGNLEGAWDAAVGAWVRAKLGPSMEQLRSELDGLVDLLIRDMARARGAREQADAAESLRSQWNLVKEQWK